MSIYTEVALAELSRGDHVIVEIGEVQIVAAVVGTNLELNGLAFVPVAYVGPTENGAGFIVARCPPVTRDSKILNVSPGKEGARVLKVTDSEAGFTEPLTWEHIAELEPRVLQLLDQIKTERPHDGNYLWIWYRYKDRLSELVGWGRETTSHPELQSSAAYDIVYDMLLHTLRDPV